MFEDNPNPEGVPPSAPFYQVGEVDDYDDGCASEVSDEGQTGATNAPPSYAQYNQPAYQPPQPQPWRGQGPNPGFAHASVELDMDVAPGNANIRIENLPNASNASTQRRQLRASHIIVTLISLAAQVACAVMFYTYVLADKQGVKGACFNSEDMDNYICVFAAGQFAKGIITVGQINFGFFCLGQCSLGLAFAVGQAAISAGWVPIAQICFAGYNSLSMVGFASYHVNRALIGFSGLKPFFVPGTSVVRTCTSD